MRLAFVQFILTAALLRAQPATLGCALSRAIQLHQSGDWDGAVREYQACLSFEPNRVEIRSNLGAVYVKLGRYQEAIEQYRTALRTAPAEIAPRLRYNLALAYYKSSQINEAKVELEFLRQLAPRDLNIALLLADCELRMGDYNQAIAVLSPVEAGNEDNDALAYVLGMALIREGRVKEGQQRVDRILKRGDSAEGHLLLGTALLTARNYPQAVTEFRKAATLNPQLPSLQSLYGQALLATGDPDGAQSAFRKELQANPNDYDANFQLASILAFRGEKGESNRLLRHAAALRPGSLEAQGALAKGFSFGGPPAAGGITIGANAQAIPGIAWSKPTVLVFGSYTCPQLRQSADALNKLYEKFGKQVDFRLVYIREAHGSGAQWESTINEREGIDLPSAANLTEKQSHAQLCVRKLKIPYSTTVDSMDDAAEKAYDAWPSRVYLVGRDGLVHFNSRLGELAFHAGQLETALREILTNEESHGGSR